MKITKSLLQELDACEYQTKLFGVIFPNGAELTLDNIKIAYKEHLSVHWLIGRLCDIHQLHDIQDMYLCARSLYQIKCQILGDLSEIAMDADSDKTYEQCQTTISSISEKFNELIPVLFYRILMLIQSTLGW